MMSTVNRHSMPPTTRQAVRLRDHDISKGAIEDGYPNITTCGSVHVAYACTGSRGRLGFFWNMRDDRFRRQEQRRD